MPSFGQQVEIAERVDRIAARASSIRAAIGDLESSLAKYRDALITEAVTGKLDVTKLGESRMAENLAAVREGERPEVLSS